MNTCTASGKEQRLVEFRRQLRRDGIASYTELARRAQVGRSALEGMLHGQRSGRHSWKRVLPLLSKEAVFHLRLCSAWNGDAEAALLTLVPPEVRIGAFTLRSLNNGEIWIGHESGEGMATRADGPLAHTIAQFWKTHF